MTTILRHPVPSESYEPDRPLNDLGRDQFEHFKHVASRLPEKMRGKLPAVPSAQDGMAASQFIAAVTGLLVARKRPALKIVSKRTLKMPETELALAASADGQKPTPKRKQNSRSKSKSRSTGT